MDKTIKLDKIISGAFVSWQVCTNCFSQTSVGLKDDETTYFTAEKPIGDPSPQQIAFGGATYGGGANLRIEFGSGRSLSRNEGTIIDERGKTVAYVYNFCIEDSVIDTDFNDVSVNIVAWEKDEYPPTNSLSLERGTSSSLALKSSNSNATPYFMSYLVSNQSGIAGTVRLYDANKEYFNFEKPTTPEHGLTEMGYGFTDIPADFDLTVEVTTNEPTYPRKYIQVVFPIRDENSKTVGLVCNIFWETGADNDYNDFYVALFIWYNK
jgi:hypothetical protein